MMKAMTMNYTLPDEKGYFGKFGGKFVPEILIPALEGLEKANGEITRHPGSEEEYRKLLEEHAGPPTKVTFARRLREPFGRGRIYLKREDLCHTGAHKINNATGQLLLAKKMGKSRIIAETGAGQHG